jgi:hypothetical protein
MSKKSVKLAGLALAGAVALIQFIQPARTNPPADPSASFEAVAKPSPQAAAVVRRACQDCHSHQTVWPWYSRVAPASWLLVSDVEEARARLNLSQWSFLGPEAAAQKVRQMCTEARNGEMPLWQYRLIHREAGLGAGDVAALCAGVASPAGVQ